MIQYFRRKGVDPEAYEPDFDLWLKLDSWTLWEAVSLALGMNPREAMRIPEDPTPNVDHQFTQEQEQLLARAIQASVEISRPLNLHFETRRHKWPVLKSRDYVYVLVTPYEFIDWMQRSTHVVLPKEMLGWFENKNRENADNGKNGLSENEEWGEVLTNDHPGWQEITHDQRDCILKEKNLDLLVDGRDFQFKSGQIVTVAKGQLECFLHFVEPGGPHALPNSSRDHSGAKASLAKLRRLFDKLGISRGSLLKNHTKDYGQPLALSFPPREGFNFAILRPK